MLRSLGGQDWKLGKGQELELDDKQAEAWASVSPRPVCEILSDSYAKELKPFQVPNRRAIYETAEKHEYEKAVLKEHAPTEKPKELRQEPANVQEVKISTTEGVKTQSILTPGKNPVKKAIKNPVKKK